MKITSKSLAWLCVALLTLYLISAILVSSYLNADRDGILAALLAANAGTAILVRFTFGLPEFSGHTSREMRILVSLIAVASGLMSALNWMADEVEHLGLRAAFIAPILAVLFVLMWFVDKVNKERTEQEQESEGPARDQE